MIGWAQGDAIFSPGKIIKKSALWILFYSLKVAPLPIFML
jgi:hypothetical protein